MLFVYNTPYSRAWPLGRVRRASKGILHTILLYEYWNNFTPALKISTVVALRLLKVWKTSSGALSWHNFFRIFTFPIPKDVADCVTARKFVTKQKISVCLGEDFPECFWCHENFSFGWYKQDVIRFQEMVNYETNEISVFNSTSLASAYLILKAVLTIRVSASSSASKLDFTPLRPKTSDNSIIWILLWLFAINLALVFWLRTIFEENYLFLLLWSWSLGDGLYLSKTTVISLLKSFTNLRYFLAMFLMFTYVLPVQTLIK